MDIDEDTYQATFYGNGSMCEIVSDDYFWIIVCNDTVVRFYCTFQPTKKQKKSVFERRILAPYFEVKLSEREFLHVELDGNKIKLVKVRRGPPNEVVGVSDEEGLPEAVLNMLPVCTILHRHAKFMCLSCNTWVRVNQQYRPLPCGHKFHIECADGWFQKYSCCPQCRRPII